MRRLCSALRLLPFLVLALLLCASRAQASQIDDKYNQLGGASSFLGAPTIAESTAPDGIGKYRHYQYGSIYWSPETGAHEVHGLIRDRWEQLGWELSYLGYPMTDEIATFDDTVGHTARVSKFQGGELIWRAVPANAVSEVRSADVAIDLPLPEGQAWVVTQANAVVDPGDSHWNAFAYCFDFQRAGVPQSVSNGTPFVAAASTAIVFVDDGDGVAPAVPPASGTVNVGNVIIQRLGEGRYASYLHNKHGSYSKNFGKGLPLPQYLPGMWPKPASGTVLAEVGDTGTGAGNYHLHFCVTTSPDRSTLGQLFESVPVAFQNYSFSTDSGGSWTHVGIGVPRKGQWLRRNAALPGQSSPNVTNVIAPPTISYGTLNGKVTLGKGTGKPSGAGKLTITVSSNWHEALRTITVDVPANNLNGPWSYSISKVPAYSGLTVGAFYNGPWSIPTGGGPVDGQSGSFSLVPDTTATKDVEIKARQL